MKLFIIVLILICFKKTIHHFDIKFHIFLRSSHDHSKLNGDKNWLKVRVILDTYITRIYLN